MYTKADGEPNFVKMAVHGIGAILLLTFLISYWPLKSVGAGERGVVTVFGKVQDNVLGEGLHLVNPVADVTTVNVQTQTISFDNGKGSGDNSESSSLFAATKDLQDVQIATVVTYHVPEGLAKTVFQQYKGLENFQIAKLSPSVRESVKAVSAQYTAEELVTKREEFSDKVNVLVAQKFSDLGVSFESFKVVNFEFSAEFTKAIELKATAVQNAEAAKNKLVQVQYEAQQRVTQAQGEADAIKIQSAAINAQGGADYVKLQAIKQWDGKLPVTQLSGATPFIDIGR